MLESNSLPYTVSTIITPVNERLPNLKLSGKLAFFLSIWPGVGHLYAGAPFVAILTFVFTLLLQIGLLTIMQFKPEIALVILISAIPAYLAIALHASYCAINNNSNKILWCQQGYFGFIMVCLYLTINQFLFPEKLPPEYFVATVQQESLSTNQKNELQLLQLIFRNDQQKPNNLIIKI
jgi:hypothetical protein